MLLEEFEIGKTFTCEGRKYLCTDRGTRTVAAIRMDSATISSSSGELRTLSEVELAQDGWFNGPPYALAELIFDEYDQEGCELG